MGSQREQLLPWHAGFTAQHEHRGSISALLSACRRSCSQAAAAGTLSGVLVRAASEAAVVFLCAEAEPFAFLSRCAWRGAACMATACAMAAAVLEVPGVGDRARQKAGAAPLLSCV